ncbi:MAG: alkaline phosphatase D family protein, partial [Pseudomonadota bacterium]
MKSFWALSAMAGALGACTTPDVSGTAPPAAPAPVSAKAALDLYYGAIPDAALPVAPAGQPLPDENQVISRILLASCNDEEKESLALAQIAREDADLFLMVGDNVYGDRQGRDYVNNDPDLMELRESFEELSGRAEFQAVRAALPMMVAWDDHDYGVNDGGGTFVFRTLAERIHERFWGLQDGEAGQHEGTYYAKQFGPDGQRVQVIMLDTRSFRSDLTPTDAWGTAGKERYVPAADGTAQDMLGEAQWQ